MKLQELIGSVNADELIDAISHSKEATYITRGLVKKFGFTKFVEYYKKDLERLGLPLDEVEKNEIEDQSKSYLYKVNILNSEGEALLYRNEYLPRVYNRDNPLPEILLIAMRKAILQSVLSGVGNKGEKVSVNLPSVTMEVIVEDLQFNEDSRTCIILTRISKVVFPKTSTLLKKGVFVSIYGLEREPWVSSNYVNSFLDKKLPGIVSEWLKLIEHLQEMFEDGEIKKDQQVFIRFDMMSFHLKCESLIYPWRDTTFMELSLMDYKIN